MSTRLIPAVVLVAAVLVGGLAFADVSKSVSSAFRGELVVTKGDLPEGKSDKDTIAKIKSARVKELTGTENDEVVYWTFQYTAFLKKAGSSNLRMEFHRDGKQFAADKRLTGIDPKSSVLSGEISISEDEGLAKGKSYVVKLVNDKNVVVATTPLVMK